MPWGRVGPTIRPRRRLSRRSVGAPTTTATLLRPRRAWPLRRHPEPLQQESLHIHVITKLQICHSPAEHDFNTAFTSTVCQVCQTPTLVLYFHIWFSTHVLSPARYTIYVAGGLGREIEDTPRAATRNFNSRTAPRCLAGAAATASPPTLCFLGVHPGLLTDDVRRGPYARHRVPGENKEEEKKTSRNRVLG